MSQPELEPGIPSFVDYATALKISSITERYILCPHSVTPCLRINVPSRFFFVFFVSNFYVLSYILCSHYSEKNTRNTRPSKRQKYRTHLKHSINGILYRQYDNSYLCKEYNKKQKGTNLKIS